MDSLRRKNTEVVRKNRLLFEKFKEIRAQDQPALVKVVTLDAMERERPDFLESCVGIASRENIRCWLGARTEDELKKCQ